MKINTDALVLAAAWLALILIATYLLASILRAVI